MKRGFTLIELVVVMVIIGILISLGVPQYITTVERGRAAEGVSILGAVRSAQLRFFAGNGAYPAAACTFTAVTDNCNLDITIPDLRFFGLAGLPNRPTRGIAVANLGTVTRNNTSNPSFGAYVLQIDEAGTITCSGGVATACARLGY